MGILYIRRTRHSSYLSLYLILGVFVRMLMAIEGSLEFADHIKSFVASRKRMLIFICKKSYSLRSFTSTVATQTTEFPSTNLQIPNKEQTFSE